MSNSYYYLEDEARKVGFNVIAGGDEAGRGPWAGPVYAAMVVLPVSCFFEGLADSKKVTRKNRVRLFHEITEQAITFGIGTASAQEIDEINILEATRLAFQRAWQALNPRPDYVLLDFIKLPWLETPHAAFPKGESLSASIAAASILAKEARDQYMEKLHLEFPQYGFSRHMGYGTKVHRDALSHHGPCSAHRRSFKPIKKLLEVL